MGGAAYQRKEHAIGRGFAVGLPDKSIIPIRDRGDNVPTVAGETQGEQAE